MTMNGYLQFCWNKSCVDVKVGETALFHGLIKISKHSVCYNKRRDIYLINCVIVNDVTL